MRWLGWIVGAASFVAVIGFVAIRYDAPFLAAERLWSQPWDEAKSHSEGLCRKITKGDDDSFVVCMAIEHKSHKILQSSFGLPEAEAAQLKRTCAEFQYFTPQVRCVEKRLGAGMRVN